MGNVHVPPNSRGSGGGCVTRVGSKKATGGSGSGSGGSGGGTPQPGSGPHCGSTEEVDSLSSGSLKAATANDCGARYIRHEEWLADVCGVSRRRSVRILLLLFFSRSSGSSLTSVVHAIVVLN